MIHGLVNESMASSTVATVPAQAGAGRSYAPAGRLVQPIAVEAPIPVRKLLVIVGLIFAFGAAAPIAKALRAGAGATAAHVPAVSIATTIR